MVGVYVGRGVEVRVAVGVALGMAVGVSVWVGEGSGVVMGGVSVVDGAEGACGVCGIELQVMSSMLNTMRTTKAFFMSLSFFEWTGTVEYPLYYSVRGANSPNRSVVIITDR